MSAAFIADDIASLADIAAQIAGLAKSIISRQGQANSSADHLGMLARQLYAARRKREKFLPDLFADPAWDILLDLFIAKVEGKGITVSSACIASAAPPTTGLRYVALLQERKLITRRYDPKDRRKCYLSLTDEGHSAVTSCITSYLPMEAPRLAMPSSTHGVAFAQGG